MHEKHKTWEARELLTIMYFNKNVKRETKFSKEGEAYVKVTNPKFKQRDEIVRDVPVAPTYGKLWSHLDFSDNI